MNIEVRQLVVLSEGLDLMFMNLLPVLVIYNTLEARITRWHLTGVIGKEEVVHVVTRLRLIERPPEVVEVVIILLA